MGHFSAERAISTPILGIGIDAISHRELLARAFEWADRKESRYVCICNVHSLVTASEDPAHRDALEQADVRTPDGMPLVWLLRRRLMNGQERVDGPDFMLRYCAEAEKRGARVFLLGGTESSLELLRENLLRRFPGLCVAGAISPPFRVLEKVEEDALIRRIVESRPDVVFVGLGCPKQEIWMRLHSHRIPAVLVGVGAAFDFIAGKISRAPAFVRNIGMEWFWRLCQDPSRLFRRYVETNSKFVWLLVREAAAKKFAGLSGKSENPKNFEVKALRRGLPHP